MGDIMKYVLILLPILLLVGCTAEGIGSNQITGNVVASDAVMAKQFSVELTKSVINPVVLEAPQNAIIILDVYDHYNRSDIFFIEGYGEERLVEGRASFYFKASKEGTFEYGLMREQNKGILKIK